MEKKLNDKDNELLSFCMKYKRSVNEIAKKLNISAASVSIKTQKLSKQNLINIDKKGVGKKTYIRTKEGDETKEFMIQALKELKEKGEMSISDFHSLVQFNPFNIEDQDKFNATLRLEHSDLVNKSVAVSGAGLAFLKEHDNKN